MHAGVPEVSTVSRNDGQTVNGRGRRNEAILNRHGFPGCTKTRQQFCPLQARVQVPGQAVNTLDPFVEPPFQRSTLLAPGKDKYPKTQLTQNHRINGDISLVRAKPRRAMRIGIGFVSSLKTLESTGNFTANH